MAKVKVAKSDQAWFWASSDVLLHKLVEINKNTPLFGGGNTPLWEPLL